MTLTRESAPAVPPQTNCFSRNLSLLFCVSVFDVRCVCCGILDAQFFLLVGLDGVEGRVVKF